MTRRVKTYRFKIAGQVHSFYGDTKAEAAASAKAWAKRHNATATAVR